MRMVKEHQKQIEKILKELIDESLVPELPLEEIVIKRIWKRKDLIMARYLKRSHEIMSELAERLSGKVRHIAREIGFDMDHIMEEKKKRFGSGCISWD